MLKWGAGDLHTKECGDQEQRQLRLTEPVEIEKDGYTDNDDLSRDD
jgi:hypothetical protein